MFLLKLLTAARQPVKGTSRMAASLGFVGTAFVAMHMLSTSSVFACASSPPAASSKSAQSVYDFTATDIDGNAVSLDKYKGHVLLIVNVASNCGYTEKHYAEMNELYKEYADSQGLRILAFPSDQFHQEPGTNAEIKKFARETKGAKYDLFAKIYVNGDETHPLWRFLKDRQGGTLVDAIKWNFTKFIVDKNGQPVERHGPQTSPLELRKNLEKYFAQQPSSA
ncbi:uncharacterized protein LOC129739801 [Uranotaenia lowii]|uniref:uncharacterized protein LOC129739801 n=1 Tax=Uranotaenia lowii TaxID=190385 RepID=UPI002479D935|nr:uncharacterized protein LOC129739801 [Uranotaenia lowii]